jgi:hypothetical protein
MPVRHRTTGMDAPARMPAAIAAGLPVDSSGTRAALIRQRTVYLACHNTMCRAQSTQACCWYVRPRACRHSTAPSTVLLFMLIVHSWASLCRAYGPKHQHCTTALSAYAPSCMRRLIRHGPGMPQRRYRCNRCSPNLLYVQCCTSACRPRRGQCCPTALPHTVLLASCTRHSALALLCMQQSRMFAYRSYTVPHCCIQSASVMPTHGSSSLQDRYSATTRQHEGVTYGLAVEAGLWVSSTAAESQLSLLTWSMVRFMPVGISAAATISERTIGISFAGTDDWYVGRVQAQWSGRGIPTWQSAVIRAFQSSAVDSRLVLSSWNQVSVVTSHSPSSTWSSQTLHSMRMTMMMSFTSH